MSAASQILPARLTCHFIVINPVSKLQAERGSDVEGETGIRKAYLQPGD